MHIHIRLKASIMDQKIAKNYSFERFRYPKSSPVHNVKLLIANYIYLNIEEEYIETKDKKKIPCDFR